MKSLMLIASLLPAALAAQQQQQTEPAMVASAMADNTVAQSSFPALQDMMIATHGIASKTSTKTALINGKKMLKFGKANLSRRPDVTKKLRAKTDITHQIVVAVKQRNMDKLEKVLHDVSDPNSMNYGKHWTSQQVAELTANPAATTFVKRYFEKRGAKVISETAHGEYVTIEAPLKVLEEIFESTFYEFEQDAKGDGKQVRRFVRAEEAFLPQGFAQHVQHVFNLIDFPDAKPVITQSIRAAKNAKAAQMKALADDDNYITNMVTPALLNQYYEIPSNTGVATTTQAVFESLNQSYSPSDLTAFQTRFNLPVEPVAEDVGGHVNDNACIADGGENCLEANLDVQYMMAVAQNVPMTYYYDDNWMLKFVEAVASMADPPSVISISYGGGEPQESYAQAFDNEAMKLGVMGVTLVASSGDDGVASFQARDRPIMCGYHPSFPASSPYVTAVGGTMGPEMNQAEVACTSDGGGVITTGGGFSDRYPVPSWQQAQVTGYFNQVLGTNLNPAKGYNANGRGYPDVSAMAASYAVMAAGELVPVYGTSASSPVVGGMIALVNSARVKAGKSTLGWINPAIYQYQDKIVLNDIKMGENNCVAGHSDAVCCSQGFYAAPGWDPVSGIGSLNFTAFRDTFLTLGDVSPVPAPTPAPSQPTAVPTQAPTSQAGWLTYSIYDKESCAGDAVIVSGVPTSKCLFQYNVNSSSPEFGQVAGSMQYFCSDGNTFAHIKQYSDQGCTEEVNSYTLFTGCTPEYTTSAGAKQSTQLTCSASSNLAAGSLPLPQTTASGAEAIYSTHVSYDSKYNGCLDSAISAFTSFLNGFCFNGVIPGETQTYSLRYNFPYINYFLEANCPSKFQTTSIIQDQTCAQNSVTDDTIPEASFASMTTPKTKQSLKKHLKTNEKKTEDIATADSYDYSYSYEGTNMPPVSSRLYGRALKSVVSSSSSGSSSDSKDFFDNKAAVSIVFIIVGAVATLLIGATLYFMCYNGQTSSTRSPLLSNQEAK